MSTFDEYLPKLMDIANATVKAFTGDLEAEFECFQRILDDYEKEYGNAKEKAQRDKTRTTTLQSIHEDDGEPNKPPEMAKIDAKTMDNNQKPVERSTNQRATKKRSKAEVEGMSSPEQEKRQKRTASVKAQSNIAKQDKQMLKALNEDGIAYVSTIKVVNVNLTQKMRRETSIEKKSNRRRGDDKENDEPVPIINIKQEKISLPPEPIDTETLPAEIEVKQEVNKDEIAMPPPAAPGPKSRKARKEKEIETTAEEKEEESSSRRTTRKKHTEDMPPPPAKGARNEKEIETAEEESEEESGRRRTTRKKNEDMPPPAASSRATRASSRASRASCRATRGDMPPPEPRPKRTRAKKKISEPSAEVPSTPAQPEETSVSSPAEKPRPKRTRRGKNAEKEAQPQKPQPEKEPEIISPKEERISIPEHNSPILQKHEGADKKQQKTKSKTEITQDHISLDETKIIAAKNLIVNETQIVSATNLNVTVTLNGGMDKTVVLHDGVYKHSDLNPLEICPKDVTVVLESHLRDTMVLDTHHVNDATVVLDKDPKPVNVTDDNSLLTEDGSENELHTPPKSAPTVQPTSAVKEKVQQFELMKYQNEVGAGHTRTKTRAMAKLQEPEIITPPDRPIKPVLSQESLTKMNHLIFNGRAPQESKSASKPTSHLPQPKSHVTSSSTSKLSSVSRQKEAAEEYLKNEREDARKKKEAMLEAKRELQKKKREEKMANAAAAREAAERDRRAALEAAARGRREKQLHVDLGKVEKAKEIERKKQELARKVAETEERRRAEVQARQQRLAEEQKKADALRRKQLEEAEAMKKETALMAKEIEKRQREYMEKKRMEDRSHTLQRTPATPAYPPVEPVYMADGFQYLNSDEDDDGHARPIPSWSTSKARKRQLQIQSHPLIQQRLRALFCVRAHSPDLRHMFPAISRARLQRTSSAVWRSPATVPQGVTYSPLLDYNTAGGAL